MKDTIKKLIPPLILENWRKRQQRKAYQLWLRNGEPSPPPHLYKQQIIKSFQKKYQINTLVETGTFLGQMVRAQQHFFSKIISIELDEQLSARARRKFSRYDHIKILHGDSGQVLSQILPGLSEPAIFWLDGHYSAGVTAVGEKETPILEELRAIFQSPHDHVVLIDDARCFDGTNDYPTITELNSYLEALGRFENFSVHNDIISFIKIR